VAPPTHCLPLLLPLSVSLCPSHSIKSNSVQCCFISVTVWMQCYFHVCVCVVIVVYVWCVCGDSGVCVVIVVCVWCVCGDSGVCVWCVWCVSVCTHKTGVFVLLPDRQPLLHSRSAAHTS